MALPLPEAERALALQLLSIAWAAQASEKDVAQMLSFLGELRAVGQAPEAKQLQPAAEAFFGTPIL